MAYYVIVITDVKNKPKFLFTKDKKELKDSTFRVKNNHIIKFKENQEELANEFYNFLQSSPSTDLEKYCSKSGVNKYLKLKQQKVKNDSIKTVNSKNCSQKPENSQQDVKSVPKTKEVMIAPKAEETEVQKIVGIKEKEDIVKIIEGETNWEIFERKASDVAIDNLKKGLKKDSSISQKKEAIENFSSQVVDTVTQVKPKDMYWEVYTDASFSPISHTAGYAVVLISSKKNAPTLQISGSLVDEINSSIEAEEYAVLKALEKFGKIRPSGKVCFYCDCQNLVDVVNEFISGNESFEDNVDNTMRNIFYYLKHLNKNKTYEFYWIRSHSGHEFNELCDKIARLENELLRSSLNN